jgi:broad specificity phosphatase PhoE
MMAKYLELRRHTESDGDFLTADGVAAALQIGTRLSGTYEIVISSGAQRATQTAACFLAGLSQLVPRGVIVDQRFRSEVEDRWFKAGSRANGNRLEDFKAADPELVDLEAGRFGSALKDALDALPDDARALIVGHSPMHEVAIYGLTGEMTAPISKGAGALVIADEDGYRVRQLD